MLSPVRLSSVCNVRALQPVEIFSNVLGHLVPWPSIDIHGKFYEMEILPWEPLRRGQGLYARRVAKYGYYGLI